MSALRTVGCGALVLLALLATHSVVAQQEDDETDPIRVGLTERVDVDLVLVDFLVLDRQGRNVPGLTVDDFKLKVGGRKTPIASVDVDCRPGDRGEAQQVPPADPAGEPAAGPRQIILVFDYFHITDVPDTIDQALSMLDRWSTGGEVHTVISLGRSVRVEAPPTTNLGDVRWAMERMRSDPDLYAGNLASLTNYRFFDRMKALFDLVDRSPGRKSIVLFSGPFQPDAFLHDPEYTELSGLSTSTRSSIYPVDTAGLVALGPDGGLPANLDPDGPLGGPPELRRLANATGGRVTVGTNDLGRAYARAQGDLGCTYTLGFYNEEPRPDKKRRLTIKAAPPNLRVVYPEFYLQRSPEEKHKSMVKTAAMAPHMFESDGVSTDLFVMGPASPSKWRAVMAVEVSLGNRETADSVELRGFLRKPNGTIVHDFKRKIRRAAGDGPRTRTFFQDLEVEPGRYVASAVLSDPLDAAPRAAVRPVQLVRIPNGSPFLIGPILGRQTDSAADGRAKRAGNALSFEPLLLPEAGRGEPLQSLTLVCMSGAEDASDVTQVARSVSTIDGSPVKSFQTDTVRLPGNGRTHCHELLDSVETSTLHPGLYEISASAMTADQRMEGDAAEFMVLHGPE